MRDGRPRDNGGGGAVLIDWAVMRRHHAALFLLVRARCSCSRPPSRGPRRWPTSAPRVAARSRGCGPACRSRRPLPARRDEERPLAAPGRGQPRAAGALVPLRRGALGLLQAQRDPRAAGARGAPPRHVGLRPPPRAPLLYARTKTGATWREQCADAAVRFPSLAKDVAEQVQLPAATSLAPRAG